MTAVRVQPTGKLGSPLSDALNPWAIEVPNTRCLRVTGASSLLGGFRFDYVCKDGSELFGLPDRRGPTWSVRPGSTERRRLAGRIAALVAWF
jgi:hypothetical protein